MSLCAEPVVDLCRRRLHLRRGVSAGIGVSLVLAALCALALLLGALALKEAKSLASLLPDLAHTARQGMQTLEQSLLDLTHQAPAAVEPLLTRSVTRAFSQSEGLWEQTSQKLPALAANLLGKVPGSALSLGTAVISAFLISARLPQLKAAARTHLPESIKTTWLPAWTQIRTTTAQWLLAQGKLMLITALIVALGLWLLKIPKAPIWAALISLVDAVPMLGTGIVLIPWALVQLLQGAPYRALGLAGIYACAMVTRTVLEPRLVGRQLDLDPLTTLIALYTGFRLGGFWGLVLAPIVLSVMKSILDLQLGKSPS